MFGKPKTWKLDLCDFCNLFYKISVMIILMLLVRILVSFTAYYVELLNTRYACIFYHKLFLKWLLLLSQIKHLLCYSQKQLGKSNFIYTRYADVQKYPKNQRKLRIFSISQNILKEISYERDQLMLNTFQQWRYANF